MIRTAIIALTVMAPCLYADGPARKPNVVVILADDQCWGDLSVNGNTNLRTPHIDSLARDGASFDRFFVQPVCSPTRAEFLTGRYHPRCGVRNVTSGGERLNLDESTIADTFKAAGYSTGCFGKWHSGSQYPYHPNGRGFDEYYGFTSGHWGEYFDPPLDHNGKAVRGRGYLADDMTTRAIEFLAANRQRPTLCYLAYNTPHSPMQVPDPYWARFASADLALRGSGPGRENLPHTRAALAMCENLDANVGRLLRAIDESGSGSDTIVIYFSDNGPNGVRWNGGMKGRKGSTDEGGVRSPLFVRWPGKVRAGTTIGGIAAAIDLFPTLADLAGVTPVGKKPRDGISLAPMLLGTGRGSVERTLLQHWAGKVSARTPRYRLDADGKLFDMIGDPGQAHDIASDRPREAEHLKRSVSEWRRDVLADISKADDRPFPVGYPAFPSTTLPARDGVPHGGIRRSAPAPNCSFFTDWKTTDDRMTWQVEVATAGQYEAVIHYTCRAADVGSSIELSLGDVRWETTVAKPHDSALRGQQEDRVPRVGESYVKDFLPLSFGLRALKPGRQMLTLRALKVAGAQIADVRSVELILRP
ncbi:MAG: arylsulfatase [Gemmataceae bacterium]